MNKRINTLELLDELDQFRRSHQNDQQHPSDWCMRVMEAIVAKAAGFDSRCEWTDALRANENSIYSKDLKDIDKIATF